MPSDDSDSIDDIIDEEVRKFYKIRSAEELDRELKRRFGIKYKDLSEKEFNSRVRHEVEDEIDNRIKNLYKNVSYESLNNKIENWLNDLKNTGVAGEIPTELQGLIWERARRKKDIARKLSEENERKLREEQARLRMEGMLAEEKLKKIKNYIKLGAAGIALIVSLYFGNEYAQKDNLNRTIKTESAFYSESEKLISQTKDVLYHPVFDIVCIECFNLNTQLEAMINLGKAKKYDVSELQKMDEIVDNTLVETVIGQGYTWKLSGFEPPEMASGYVKALKNAYLKTHRKYRGIKIKDDEAYNRAKSFFEDKAKELGAEMEKKCLEEIEGIGK